MKKTTRLFSFFLLSAVFNSNFASAQGSVSVKSTDGYTVNIAVVPTAIVTNATSCQYGYNYNVRLSYNINFEGPNQPASLYMLNGAYGYGTSMHAFDMPKTQGAGFVFSHSNVWRSENDCATATVAIVSGNQVTLEIEGPGISRQFVSFTIDAPVSGMADSKTGR